MGQDFRDGTWSKDEFPSDSFLVMNLFYNFMSSKVEDFTERYTCSSRDKSKPTSVVKIRLQSKEFCHYNICYETNIYEVLPNVILG